ncbi:hypothetical protein F2Q70_00036739 [Brassica cretica]|uniref:Uncharacterized protein n=2 Tax=Brassica cretica TaxID=69181 RepID=A0A3N6SUN4_BRACR|nr:hypothetical protein F2Q70_00036739 [Brassica cretica]KAF3530289.1 hypothetical protein DY000_02041995 [Brassica cretica]KAF3602624.1 hypothetical protein F2Q69_00037531 [Brassica cretica]
METWSIPQAIWNTLEAIPTPLLLSNPLESLPPLPTGAASPSPTKTMQTLNPSTRHFHSSLATYSPS